MSSQPVPPRPPTGGTRIEDALNADVWDVDEKPHILVDTVKCASCKTRPCLALCPASTFALLEEKVIHSYEGCLECGTCRIICPMAAITWSYPLSGKGVQYRF